MGPASRRGLQSGAAWALAERILLIGLTAILARGVLAFTDNSPRSAESPAELLGFLGAEARLEPSLRHGVRGASGRRRLPEFTPGKLGESYDVKERGSTAADNGELPLEGNIATPPAWDSALCMLHWGKPELQNEPDPNGYVIYVNGREQLGGNKFLVSDGIFMAKALNRTFVEYPVRDSRVVPFDEATLGLGAYWDLPELCMYHRILDLRKFRQMVADGRIPPEGFTTVRSGSSEQLLRYISDEAHIVDYFKDYVDTKVIVMESTWKSGISRDPLLYLRPNPFFLGIVRMLLEEQKDWGGGQFVAVQWRTELSGGNLTDCYEEVKSVVEQQRLALGLGAHQVLFNTDLYGKTSGTYTESAQAAGSEVLHLIQKDYPQALDNEVHHFIKGLKDSGIKAFVSGLAVASSEVMIGSSLNDPETKTTAEAYRCQKPYSGYIKLITEWREDMLGKAPESVFRLFPFGD